MAASQLVTGAGFGAALLASGVYQPSVIIAQMRLENWHMMQAFLTAAATSTVFVHLLGRHNRISLKPRTPVTLGLLSPYDGNILGGALLGAGMTLSGACPGTFLAQVAVGTRSGFHALEGGILAGVLFIGYVGPWVARRTASTAARPDASDSKSEPSVHSKLGSGRTTAVAAFVALSAAIIAATPTRSSQKSHPLLRPLLGGLLIALSQLLSAGLRSSLIGTSTAFEEIGSYFWWLAGGANNAKKPGAYANLLFSAGIIAGSAGLAYASPDLLDGPGIADVEVTRAAATIGGFLMVLGSRIAGGCTSGHGISGISLLSISSFVTIGTAFAVGALVAPLVY